jgi:glycosyltransferase involved in cell wall biosynthesis
MTQHDAVRVPAFSVVIPAYNTAKTIDLALESVLAQSVSSFEVLVVDDGSTDDTPAHIERFRDPRLSVLQLDHRGAAAARNAGLSAARGPLVAFLDSDDLWLPNYLEEMGRALAAVPDAGFAFTDAWVIDATGRRVRKTSVVRSRLVDAPPVEPASFFLRLLEENFVYTSACVRREVLEAVGGFDERLTAGIDYELWLRVAAHGFRGVRAPGRLAIYRTGRPGSISSSRHRVASGLATVYQHVVEEYPVDEAARERARRRLAQTQDEVAALEGELSPRAVWLRLKPHLASAKHAVLRDEGWYSTPPSELTAALPELFAGDERTS